MVLSLWCTTNLSSIGLVIPQLVLLQEAEFHLHTQSKANQLPPGCGENAVFVVGRQARNPGQVVLKTPEPPDVFQQSLFKGHVRKGSACMFMHSSLVEGEVPGWPHTVHP